MLINYAIRIVDMDLVAFHATSKLENKLSGIYEILYRKESQIAAKINRYAETKKCNNISQALSLHLTLNLSAIAGSFYLLY